MLDFRRVNKPDFRYSLLYRYVQFVHNHIYYRRYHVVNKHNIPPRGEGFMVICNHQNGLNDALGILFSMNGRFPVFIARADIFKKVQIRCDRFDFEPEITAKVLKQGVRLYELPISYYGRDYAEGKKITWKDGIWAVMALVRFRFSD